ncbi:thioredoxin domain-containing protein 17 isoform X2 [Marmota monax]|uniref:thioredoxin domain-containing protein 17 isoform X2 n=1 Tax=Marmota monax TaxID=9995 RepID=UPI001EB095BA|nr:thioredoxin domain-containing protein 17 isoform X2 [Marmota monax]
MAIYEEVLRTPKGKAGVPTACRVRPESGYCPEVVGRRIEPRALCIQAEPVVREGLKHISKECVFIHCQVGEKPYWKDPNNDFRKQLKVTAVPTLIKYGTPQKLVESECLHANLVEMLFSED